MRRATLFGVLTMLLATGPSDLPAPSSHRTRRPVLFLITELSRFAPGLRPFVQRVMIRAVYELLSIFSPDAMMFMNYGYAATTETAPNLTLQPEDESNRYGIQLYNAVIASTDLGDKHVLEVGCGRGGGSAFVAQYLHPQRLVGLDLATKAIAFCRGHYHLESLSFEVGNAENLPFPPESFDVVLNVESSHAYPSPERFFREAYRVLRPNGDFLFADFRPQADLGQLRQQLVAAGFVIQAEESITANIVSALDLDSERRFALVRSHVPSPLRALVREFAAVKNTDTYNKFYTGELQYTRFVLRKDG